MGQFFETTEVELAEHILGTSYGGGIRLAADRGATGLRLDITPIAPGVRLDQINLGFDFGLRANPLGVVVICHIRGGSVAYPGGRTERGYGPGDAFVPVPHDRAYTALCQGTDFTTAVLDPDLPARIAETAPGRSPAPVRFTSGTAIPPRAARIWGRTHAYVRATFTDLAADTYPLLADGAARMLVATALAVFPNNSLADPTIEDRHDARPVALRRAIAFIDDNAHRAITAADIAAAAFVTIRTIQLAFRTHLDTTPMAYLRRVRLEAVHRALRAADPATTSISAVAMRWGFGNQSRFAATYRAAYGVTPTRTLRRE
jgi:AraC-like DNA-binding protein